MERDDQAGRFCVASALKLATQYLHFPTGDAVTDTAYRLPGFEKLLESVYYFGQKGRFPMGERAMLCLPDFDPRSLPRREDDGTTDTSD